MFLTSKQNFIIWPKNKNFAFSIFDDTDKATVKNIKPIYDLLEKLKIYTTKSVFIFSKKNPIHEADTGMTLEDSEYSSFILNLRDKGFEIGFHGAKGGSSKRGEIQKALEIFKEKIGYYPKTYANHLNNKESLYWGKDRLDSFLLRFFYYLATCKRKQSFCGHIVDSEYFWGDIVRDKIKYVRNFVFSGINTLKYNPSMPYYDKQRPYVNFWFSSSDGHNVETFNKLLSQKNINRLEKEGGGCIVYTHFANGFVKNGQVNQETKKLLINLSKRNGWFVPVGRLLDFLQRQHFSNIIPKKEKIKMEYKWFLNKMIHGTS